VAQPDKILTECERVLRNDGKLLEFFAAFFWTYWRKDRLPLRQLSFANEVLPLALECVALS